MAFVSFAGGSCSFRTGCGSAKERILQCQRLLRQWKHDFVLSVHHSVSLFRPLQVQSLQWFLCEEAQLVDTLPGMWSGGVECWPVWVRLYAFGREKKSCCSVLIRRAPAHTHTHTHTHSYTYTRTPVHTHTHTHPQTHIHILSMAIKHMRNVHAIICIYIDTRCN